MKNFTKVLKDASLQAELKAIIDNDQYDEVNDGLLLLTSQRHVLDTCCYSSEDALVFQVVEIELNEDNCIYSIDSFIEHAENLKFNTIKTVYFAEKTDLAEYMQDKIMSNHF